MENKELIGKKVKGFEFEDNKHIYFAPEMYDYIGKIGEIKKYDIEVDCYTVEFEDDVFDYPAELIEQHLVEEPPFDEKAYLEKSNKQSLNDAVLDGIKECVEDLKEPEIKTPDYYDNTKGSLYKIAEQRKWNAYIFDVVKRLERGNKKDPLKQEIEKSIAVLQLWLKEIE